MTEAQSIARVVRSVVDTFKRRGWSVSLCRSSKSLSRYVYAQKGNRKMKVRVSDHRPNSKTVCDLSYMPRYYRQKQLASFLDGKKRRPRNRLRKKHPR